MHIDEQIRNGKLCCPQTYQPLRKENNMLVSADGMHRYALQGNVPIFLDNAGAVADILKDKPQMEREYQSPSIYQRIRKFFYTDHNSKAYDEAFNRYIKNQPVEALTLEIGGGPGRSAAHITNINIGPYANVDVVGDAHHLPYGDETVDAICHAAVLEHVQDPVGAVREMRRVLKKGGVLFSSIPFLQAYHGYPDHYQNYTLSGHGYLYESHGFEIITSGAAKGPISALFTMNARFFLEYFPPVLNLLFGRGIQLVGALLSPLDRWLEKRNNYHVLASTTFVLARKR